MLKCTSLHISLLAFASGSVFVQRSDRKLGLGCLSVAARLGESGGMWRKDEVSEAFTKGISLRRYYIIKH